MYYQESEILLQKNPEYERYIVELDRLLGTMESSEGNLLNIDIISDITGIKLGIVKYIFDCYCMIGVLNAKEYILCPNESCILNEIDDVSKGRLPLKEFCDICGTEHVITEADLSIRYSLNNLEKIAKNDSEDSNRDKPIIGKMREQNSIDAQLQDIFISRREIEIVRVATVQLDYNVSDTFPPKVIKEYSIREKIIQAIETAEKCGVNIICFPELCVYEEWLSEIELNYPSIAVVAGTYYDQANHNTCRLLINSKLNIPNQEKIKPSEFEAPIMTGIGMTSGDKIFIYETQFGKISILICRDFGNFIGLLSDKVDFVFVPSYNESPNRFEEIAQSHVSNHPSYIIISNASAFGGTSIFGQIDRVYFKRLEEAGCKEKDSDNFKLCEIERGKEGMIFADFNMIYKGVQKPTPIDPLEVKRSVIHIKKIELGNRVA